MAQELFQEIHKPIYTQRLSQKHTNNET